MEYQTLTSKDKIYPQRLLERMGDEAPTLYCHGPLQLLKKFTLGVICADDIPADAFLAGNQALFTIREYYINYVGGWMSFYETEIFRLGLYRKNQTVTCFSCKGLNRESFKKFLLDRFYPPGHEFPERDEYFRRAENGEMLMISVTEPDCGRTLIKNVKKRNYVACALSDLVFIPFAEKGTKTMTMAKRIVKADISCFTTDDSINKELHSIGVPGYNRESVKELLDGMGAPLNLPEDDLNASNTHEENIEPIITKPAEKRPEQMELKLGRIKSSSRK